MQKNIIGTVLVFCMTFLLASCDLQQANNSANILQSEVQTTPSTPESALHEKTIPAKNSVFINISCGYQLIFPDEWKEYYYVDDTNPDAIEIFFYGKSKTGSVLYEELGCYGLPMFYILSESELAEGTYDSARPIGEVDGMKFFYATATGSDINILYWVAEQAPGAPTVDNSELELVKQDWEKVQQMQEDVNTILQTFKAI